MRRWRTRKRNSSSRRRVKERARAHLEKTRFSGDTNAGKMKRREERARYIVRSGAARCAGDVAPRYPNGTGRTTSFMNENSPIPRFTNRSGVDSLSCQARYRLLYRAAENLISVTLYHLNKNTTQKRTFCIDIRASVCEYSRASYLESRTLGRISRREKHVFGKGDTDGLIAIKFVKCKILARL